MFLDAKDSKGKGLGLRQRRAGTQLESVADQMRVLAARTDQLLQATPLRLRYCQTVPSEGRTPVHQLRWRLCARGMPWLSVPQFVDQASRQPHVLRISLLQLEAQRIELVQTAKLLRAEYGLLSEARRHWRLVQDALAGPLEKKGWPCHGHSLK
ncbi:hypothetical protein [Ralstonia sp. 1138]|uniref:hypothetical protein n=1 Tax=Ralstonia sp. 1138 TaxID=3156423 RepID=UPI0033977797